MGGKNRGRKGNGRVRGKETGKGMGREKGGWKDCEGRVGERGEKRGTGKYMER